MLSSSDIARFTVPIMEDLQLILAVAHCKRLAHQDPAWSRFWRDEQIWLALQSEELRGLALALAWGAA